MSRMPLRWLLCAAVACTYSMPAVVRAGDAALPADLAFVPADAVVFVHVRLADVWKSEHFKEWRDTLLKAGDEAIAAFDKRFVPAPSSIDRLTVAASKNDQNPQQPDLIVILSTTKPVDRESFLERMAPGNRKEEVGGKTYYEVPKQKIALHFINDRTLVFGSTEAVQRALRQALGREGDMSPALKLAQSGKPMVVAVNTAALKSLVPPQALQQVPLLLQPALEAKLATLTLDFEKNGRIDLRLVYANARQADDAEDAVKSGMKMARMLLGKAREELQRKVVGDGKPGTLEELPEAAGSLFAMGIMGRLDELLAAPPLTKEGSALQLSLQLPQGGSTVLSLGAISAGLLLPAVQKVREAASRTQDQNNLKQMALAMHSYADVNKGFPPAAICDQNGKPLLSWRVAILPYIEQDGLYRQFKLDEPWDSEHNKKLIPSMPQIYYIPSAPMKTGETHYRVFVGGGAMFDLDKKVGFQQITDGTSNTLMIVETEESGVWTKPQDVAYDPQKPLPKFAPFYANGFNAALADGSVRFISRTIAEATLRAAITRAGGEVPGADW
jgi:uncharacterized protein DUF1559